MRDVSGNDEGGEKGGRKWEVLLELVLSEMVTEWLIIKIIRLCRVRESSPFRKTFAPPFL